MNIKKSERGQALYLLLFGIISLIGFTALAIDGGRLYSERRVIQGVSDTAAFTGGVYIGQSSNITSTVINNAIAAANEIAVDNGYDDADGDVSVTTTIYYWNYFYVVTTIISSEIDPTFAQLVYDGPMRVEAKAVVRVLPVANMVMGNALVSLNRTACDALYFSGNANIDINGSGIFSNSNAPGGGCASVTFEGTNNTDIEGDISMVGGINSQGGATYSGASVNQGVPQYPWFDFPVPDCTGMPPISTFVDTDGIRKYTPGYKNDSLIISGGTNNIRFLPGLYCISGADGLKILTGPVLGNGVMFYVKGPVSVAGGNEVKLYAPTDGSIVDSSGEVWDGMLFYVDGGYPVTLNGSANSTFQGTVYAPTSTCNLNGGGSTTGHDLSMICSIIKVNGGTGLTINYNNTNQYVPPTKLDLLE